MKAIDKIKGIKGDEGFILILALVTMLALTLIGLSVVMNLTTDLGLSRNEREAKLATQLAEAGINEAISRFHLAKVKARYVGENDTGPDPGYRTTAWNADDSKNFGFNGSADRRSADNLNYAVDIKYLDETNNEDFCDSNENLAPNTSLNSSTFPAAWTCVNTTPEIVMFGRDFKMNDTLTKISYGKLPVYRITSTGTSNATSKTIIAYVGASNLNTDTDSAINTNGCINIAGGAATITGGVKEAGTGGCTTCNDGLGCNVKASDDMVTYLGVDFTEVIDMANEKHKCKNATCSAVGDDIPSSGKIDTVVTDWGDYAGNTYSTMIYIDNSGGKEAEISGNFQGRGILVVSGDLKLSGTLAYEGLVYVFGTLTISGGGSDLNVTGGIMADSTVGVNGNVTVTYDQQTLLDVSKENSTSAVILWKRL